MRVLQKAIIKYHLSEARVKHYSGFPEELEKGGRKLLPLANILVIEGSDQGYFLYRYSSNGEFAGDTWHRTLEEAYDQAENEFDILPDDWEKLPSEVENIHDYLFPDK